VECVVWNVFHGHYTLPKMLYYVGWFCNNNDIFIFTTVICSYSCVVMLSPDTLFLSVKISDNYFPLWPLQQQWHNYTQEWRLLVPPQYLGFGSNVTNFSPFNIHIIVIFTFTFFLLPNVCVVKAFHCCGRNKHFPSCSDCLNSLQNVCVCVMTHWNVGQHIPH